MSTTRRGLSLQVIIQNPKSKINNRADAQLLIVMAEKLDEELLTIKDAYSKGTVALSGEWRV